LIDKDKYSYKGCVIILSIPLGGSGKYKLLSIFKNDIKLYENTYFFSEPERMSMTEIEYLQWLQTIVERYTQDR
jgi:hypothetical protein